MARFLLNPVFDIETGKLLSHDGESFEDAAILFDRGATSTAKSEGQQAGQVAGQSQANANQIYSSIVPGLVRQAQTPTGFTAQQLNNQLTAAGEAAGGANATATGEGRLAALRSRTAGGFAPALDEASRNRARTLATTALDVQNQNARLGLERQAQAQQQLQGLYGTNTSDMLKAMGLQQGDLQNQLAAGRQGWLQNTEGVLNTLGNLGKNVAGAAYGSQSGFANS
jgi:hypothetical protein